MKWCKKSKKKLLAKGCAYPMPKKKCCETCKGWKAPPQAPTSSKGCQDMKWCKKSKKELLAETCAYPKPKKECCETCKGWKCKFDFGIAKEWSETIQKKKNDKTSKTSNKACSDIAEKYVSKGLPSTTVTGYNVTSSYSISASAMTKTKHKGRRLG